MSFTRRSFATPGYITGPTSAEREWLYTASASPNNSPPVYLPAGRIIDGSKSRDPLNTGDVDVLRPGLLMGKITASGKYAPSIIGVTASAAASGATGITVSAAVATEIVRRIGSTGTFLLTNVPSAAGTVAHATVTYSAVNTSTGVITNTALGAAAVAGSLVRPLDGSQTIKGGLDDFIKVTDDSSTDQDTSMPRLCVSGFADASQIINYPADTSLQAWLKGQMNDPTNACGPFRFDDNF